MSAAGILFDLFLLTILCIRTHHLSTNCVRMMAVIDPKKSWASKWHHLVRVVPGLYAVKIPDTVYDKLSDETRDRLEELKQGE